MKDQHLEDINMNKHIIRVFRGGISCSLILTITLQLRIKLYSCKLYTIGDAVWPYIRINLITVAHYI